ncbi:MAG TPA: hypothetical protein VG755_41355 [Nannocystaceae bacterium]|nr:hypothetical protein [Nannocystaceae bacterium]
MAGALAAGPAPARVRVVAERDAVSDWLVARLLEEGFTVTGAGDAGIDLTVARADRTWALTAEGATREQLAVPIDADDGVARLELLHVAVGALESVQPRVPEHAAVRTFAIELAPVFAPILHHAIEAELAHAVLDSGAALAPTRASASFVLCAGFADGAVDVAVRGADEPCPVAEASTASVRDQAVEVVAIALHGAEPEPAIATPAKDSERAPLDEPEPTPKPETSRRTWSDAGLYVRGGASLGVIGRVRTPDPVVAASFFIGREPGIAAWLDLQIWPEGRSRDLFVLEVLPAAGMRIRAWSRGRLSIDVGGLLGIQAHGYRFGSDDQRATGIAFDMSGEGAIGLAVRLWRSHELLLLFRGGRSSRDRRHLLDDAIVWRRSSWRIGATIGVTFGRELRR